MPAGSIDPAEARSAMTPVGSSVTDGGVDRQEEHHRVGGRSLVRIERVELLHGADAEGVAALPRPSALADMFRIIAPIAG
jgi:hypothetical protein